MTKFRFWYYAVGFLFRPCHALSFIRAAVYQPPPQIISENPLAILTQATEALNIASKHGVEILLFPELFLSDSWDRESRPLSIIGNVCSELNIACVIGYCEKRHKSEIKPGEDDQSNLCNSIAAFNADGTRAGNYRSTNIKSGQQFMAGHPFVEVMPIVLQLPSSSETPQELKVGMLLGNDILMPENCRYLARNGADLLLVAASMEDQNIVNHIVPTRAMENELPLMFSNYVGQAKEKEYNEYGKVITEWIGSSGIISKSGRELVRAPCEEGGDMLSDEGYLLPCFVGELYAADIDISSQQVSSKAAERSKKYWIMEAKQGTLDTIAPSRNTNLPKKKGFGSDATRFRESGKKNKPRRK
eukprot:CAMPEP_0194256494 /NCGR_PEP_ID=MMETSP0158-20130606/36818_1 /TAXON_ID=33649 /ORGANISM="Thalassionema nitzschioides, Strain L26-B" /LENGTH=358 /DNA_ID=CAMNT_0038995195 /DNA_START=45 /DNA_END=1121 /DNA_ORIENTATION=+